MSTTTDMRDLYLQAEADLLRFGRSTVLDGRSLTTADLPEIRAGRQEWERRAAAESASSAGQRLGISVANFSDG